MRKTHVAWYASLNRNIPVTYFTSLGRVRPTMFRPFLRTCRSAGRSSVLLAYEPPPVDFYRHFTRLCFFFSFSLEVCASFFFFFIRLYLFCWPISYWPQYTLQLTPEYHCRYWSCIFFTIYVKKMSFNYLPFKSSSGFFNLWKSLLYRTKSRNLWNPRIIFICIKM